MQGTRDKHGRGNDKSCCLSSRVSFGGICGLSDDAIGWLVLFFVTIRDACGDKDLY